MHGFKLKIMHIGVWMESKLFQLRDMLMFTLNFIFLCLLILKLAEIHDFTNRRRCIRNYLYEIKSTLLCKFKCFRWMHDADLSMIIDHAHFRRADFFVDTYSF